jgi:hypothetical protein
MNEPISESDLEAYLDEALPAEEMAAIEETLRGDAELGRRLAAINRRRDAGLHSLGEIWRRARLTCPTREQLGGYLLEILDDGEADYIAFHLETVRCRVCRANLDDLEAQRAEQSAAAETRRRKYFQSSAGYLKQP